MSCVVVVVAAVVVVVAAVVVVVAAAVVVVVAVVVPPQTTCFWRDLCLVNYMIGLKKLQNISGHKNYYWEGGPGCRCKNTLRICTLRFWAPGWVGF